MVLLLAPAGIFAQWHQYNYPDTVSVAPGVTSVINVRANDDMSPPLGSFPNLTNPVICDYPWPWGSFGTMQGGTWAVLNLDSVSYTPPSGFVSGWDYFLYATCEQGDPYQYDTAKVLVFVDPLLGTQNPAWSAGISISPNPATNQLRLVGPRQSEWESLAILSVTGQRIGEAKGNSGPMDISGLPVGIYWLEVRMGQEWHHLRFIKQ